jgi:hypothetical protein
VSPHFVGPLLVRATWSNGAAFASCPAQRSFHASPVIKATCIRRHRGISLPPRRANRDGWRLRPAACCQPRRSVEEATGLALWTPASPAGVNVFPRGSRVSVCPVRASRPWLRDSGPRSRSSEQSGVGLTGQRSLGYRHRRFLHRRLHRHRVPRFRSRHRRFPRRRLPAGPLFVVVRP